MVLVVKLEFVLGSTIGYQTARSYSAHDGVVLKDR